MKKKNPAAQALGRLGGKARLKSIGPEGFAEMGKRRLKTMTPEERRAIATKASKAAARARKRKKENSQ
jgi:hypothetical protein